MAYRKLSQGQKDAVIQWIAEGLSTLQIIERASHFDPPFEISAQLKRYYVVTYRDAIKQLRDEIREDLFGEGLALAEARVRNLIRLAKDLEDDLFEKRKRWIEDVKGIGSGDNYERVTFEQFNAAEIKELRAIYDDIARETGGRIARTDVTSKGKRVKTYVTVSPDDWDEPDEQETG